MFFQASLSPTRPQVWTLPGLFVIQLVLVDGAICRDGTDVMRAAFGEQVLPRDAGSIPAGCFRLVLGAEIGNA